MEKNGVTQNFGQKFDNKGQREAGSLATTRWRPDANEKARERADELGGRVGTIMPHLL